MNSVSTKFCMGGLKELCIQNDDSIYNKPTPAPKNSPQTQAN